MSNRKDRRAAAAAARANRAKAKAAEAAHSKRGSRASRKLHGLLEMVVFRHGTESEAQADADALLAALAPIIDGRTGSGVMLAMCWGAAKVCSGKAESPTDLEIGIRHLAQMMADIARTEYAARQRLAE